MILGELGADVIKVEEVGKGDRYMQRASSQRNADWDNTDFLWSNRNKRSVIVDTSHPAALNVLERLVQRSDIVIDDLKEYSDRSALKDHIDEWCRQNSKIIQCAISSFPAESAFATRKETDATLQAQSGFMSMVGEPDREGLRTGSSIVDIVSSMFASNAVLAATFSKLNSGRGQAIEVSSYLTSITLLGVASFQYLFSGKIPTRHGNISISTAPSGVFSTQDATFHISCSTTAIFQRLFEQVLGRPDIANDPELADRMGRMRRRDELFKLLREAFQPMTWAVLGPKLREAGVAVGEMRSVQQALTSGEVVERDLILDVPYFPATSIPGIALPFYPRSPAGKTPGAVPVAGQHTVEVLRDVLDCAPDEIASLLETGCCVAVAESLTRQPNDVFAERPVA